MINVCLKFYYSVFFSVSLISQYKICNLYYWNSFRRVWVSEIVNLVLSLRLRRHVYLLKSNEIAKRNTYQRRERLSICMVRCDRISPSQLSWHLTLSSYKIFRKKKSKFWCMRRAMVRMWPQTVTYPDTESGLHLFPKVRYEQCIHVLVTMKDSRLTSHFLSELLWKNLAY